MNTKKVVGIDIGATKTHIGVVQGSEVINEIIFPTAAKASKETIIQNLITGIEKAAGSDFAAIGIGVPGLVDEENGIIYDLLNIPSWKEVHLKRELGDYFGKPVKITNDANVFVLGEKAFGKASEYRNIVGITLGSGFGTGIIIDHKLYSGTLSSAGELGGLPYLDKTIEDYCSGKFFRDMHHTDGTSLFKRAEEGDAAALAIFEEYGTHLGNALQIVLHVLSPEAVFFGGSVSRAFPFFEASLRSRLESVSFKRITAQLVIEKSEIQKISILGAAALYKTAELEKLIINSPLLKQTTTA